jgi:hypothetical protein
VSDLWIKPNWDNFVTHDIEVEVSRIPMFANYEFKISELLRDLVVGDDPTALDQLDYLDEEARSFITERDSWKKESSILEKAGLDLSKFIEETENEYWNPIIPSSFNWNSDPDIIGSLVFEDPEPPVTGEFLVEPYQSRDLVDGEWISVASTRDRRPPVPFDFAKGSSIQLEMSKETNSLMEVLRTTKIDYVEIPKKSLEFFEDQESVTQKVIDITNNLDTSKIQMIEDKINDVLRMKGDTDPWSRKVSLASPSSPNVLHRLGAFIRVTKNFDFDAKKARIIQLQWKGRMPKRAHLEIEDLEIPSRRIIAKVPSNWQNLVSITEDITFRILGEKDAISEWKKVLDKAELNQRTFENHLADTQRHMFLKDQKINLEEKQAKLRQLYELETSASKSDVDELDIQRTKELIDQSENEIKTILSSLKLADRSTSKTAKHYRGAKEQLALVAEIVNELQLSLAFYEEADLILKMFKLEDYEIPDVDRNNPLRFLHTQLSHLGQHSTWGLEQDTLEQYQVSPKYRKKTMFEAYMSELNGMKDGLEKQRETTFEVESPYRHKTRLRKDVLSFGQKSTILTELYLGTFEALSTPSSDIGEGSFNENRYCLIIDEPEVGRSEYSLNHLITRLISSKTAHDAELNNSVVVLSHRNKLLKQVSGKYHLLQPVDIGYQTEEE